MSRFVVPFEAAVVIRCLALEIDVDGDRMERAAKMLPVRSADGEVSQSEVNHWNRLEQMADELSEFPQHFILNDKLWQQ